MSEGWVYCEKYLTAVERLKSTIKLKLKSSEIFQENKHQFCLRILEERKKQQFLLQKKNQLMAMQLDSQLPLELQKVRSACLPSANNESHIPSLYQFPVIEIPQLDWVLNYLATISKKTFQEIFQFKQKHIENIEFLKNSLRRQEERLLKQNENWSKKSKEHQMGNH